MLQKFQAKYSHCPPTAAFVMADTAMQAAGGPREPKGVALKYFSAQISCLFCNLQGNTAQIFCPPPCILNRELIGGFRPGCRPNMLFLAWEDKL